MKEGNKPIMAHDKAVDTLKRMEDFRKGRTEIEPNPNDLARAVEAMQKYCEYALKR